MITRILSLFSIVCVLIAMSCTNQLSEITSPRIVTPVNGLIATYVDSLEIVNLSWNNNGQYGRYILYRTSDSNGVFDNQSTKRIVYANNTCQDVVGLTNGTYSYKICPLVKNESDRWIEGAASNVAMSRVGSAVSFSINSGNIYIVENVCDLCIRDNDSIIKNVRFSDSTINKIPVFGVKNVGLGVVKEGVTTKYKWTLPQGPGLKTVYAEITSGSRVDTLVDDIKIQPYKVVIKFRNSMVGDKKEMVLYPLKSKINGVFIEEYVINKPWVDFSITTFSDSTLDTNFEYWFQTRDSIQGLTQIAKSSINLTTGHWPGKLTGLGANHDDLFKYRINLSPDSAEQNVNSQASFNLKSLYDDKGVLKSSPTATFRDNFNRLKFLKYAETSLGRKEFAVVLKMKGRFFNDTRIIYSNPKLTPGQLQFSSLDFYPPQLRKDAWSQDHYLVYGDKSEITGPALIKVDSCIDAGNAKIISLSLYITEMTDSLQNNWNSSSITFDMITKWRSKIIPFPTSKDYLLTPVTWNVDISSIPSRWYMFTYVAEDEFGNKGISYLKSPMGPQPNPYRIKINSGETNR